MGPTLGMVGSLVALGGLTAGCAGPQPDPPVPADRFIEGYASALLDAPAAVDPDGVPGARVSAADGELLVRLPATHAAHAETIRARLASIAGVDAVHVATIGNHAGIPATASHHDADAFPWLGRAPGRTIGFLPPTRVFEEVLADPRWPATGVAYQHVIDGNFETIGAASFGLTAPLYGWRTDRTTWQIGIQGGVFSIFDLDVPSRDLLNTDYLVALPLHARRGRLAGQLRLLHESSHLGDEFMEHADVDRENVSFEEVDLLASYDLTPAWRVYAGGGAVVQSRTDLVGDFSAQLGGEFRGTEPWLDSLTYPVAGVDLQAGNGADWRPAISGRGGLEVRPDLVGDRTVQLLLEYFDGALPHGQFRDREARYVGFGLRLPL